MEYERVSETVLVGEIANLREQEERTRKVLSYLEEERRRRECEYLMVRAESALEARVESDHE
jgi:hypothetical protein